MLVACEAQTETEPETLFVGQDRAGHWLVQASTGCMEGRFISFAAAMKFARGELGMFPGSCIQVRETPLVATVSFAPVQPWEQALPQPANADALPHKRSA